MAGTRLYLEWGWRWARHQGHVIGCCPSSRSHQRCCSTRAPSPGPPPPGQRGGAVDDVHAIAVLVGAAHCGLEEQLEVLVAGDGAALRWGASVHAWQKAGGGQASHARPPGTSRAQPGPSSPGPHLVCDQDVGGGPQDGRPHAAQLRQAAAEGEAGGDDTARELAVGQQPQLVHEGRVGCTGHQQVGQAGGTEG